MIARYWSARLHAHNLAAYREHLEHNVFPELKSLFGFLRAELLTRELASNEIEAVVISTWNSLESIDAFAAPDRNAAVVAPAAAALFISYDLHVRHFQVLSSI